MDIQATRDAPTTLDTDLLVVPIPTGTAPSDHALLTDLDAHVGGVLTRAAAAGDFQGRDKDQLLAYRTGDRGPERVLFLGIGDTEEHPATGIRDAAGRGVRAAESQRLAGLALCLAHLTGDPDALGQWAAEGLVLASWRFEELQAEAEEPIPLVSTATVSVGEASAWDQGLERGRAFGIGENLARTLQARPGNVATPTHLADEARRISARVGLECTVLGPSEMETEAMGALLSVAQGSDQEPRLIILHHRGGGADEAPLALVGKGLTFDAGGISLKPSKGMEEMKYDMSGGAAVLGAMLAIGELGLPINVVAVVPSSENLINGSATKPGDVITSRAGTTIEVINTDAEGRLILADALDYTVDMSPAAIVDCATLTGACVVALGHRRSAVMGNDDQLLAELRAAGDAAGEPCWPLPIDEEYHEQLESDVADLKNVGGRPAGSITAACFLSRFVGTTPWAHLDIAGTAYGETKRPFLRKGPLGNPCRLLLEWVHGRAVT